MAQYPGHANSYNPAKMFRKSRRKQQVGYSVAKGDVLSAKLKKLRWHYAKQK